MDDPEGAIREADDLIQSVMRERGYPVEDFDQRAADLSVDHPDVVENYREGHDLAGARCAARATPSRSARRSCTTGRCSRSSSRRTTPTSGAGAGRAGGGASMSAAELQPVLLADDDAAELRDALGRLQARFVDEPQEAVREADGLVSDVFDQVTRTFASERESLEEQWNRGEEASTEDLRCAARCRSFFERLLAV